jgi:hypothetical protein
MLYKRGVNPVFLKGRIVKFLKSPKKNGKASNVLISAIPMTGETLTKILRGVFEKDPVKGLADSKKELIENQGFSDFITKKGEKELLAVLRGEKKFVGETNHPDGLETVPEKRDSNTEPD